MPKRVDYTPDEDEYDLFTVVNPYPLNANMELPGDRFAFAQWMEAVTGNRDVVIALYHKPSAPRTVIVSLTKTYGRENHRRVLGRHQSSGPRGFLKDPPVGVTDANYSGIFYCRYTLHTQATKIGWKCFEFLDYMFGDRDIQDKLFQKPYPVTTSMPIPPDDAIAFDLCSPLPVAMFGPNANQPRVNKIPTATVGSTTWHALRNLAPAKDSGVPAEEGEGNEVKDEESVNLDPVANLWGGAYVSDLPQSSMDGENEDEVCPHHGITCKKMCSWRSEREKKKGPKVGGPSNTKNYRLHALQNNKGSSKSSQRSGKSTPAPSIGTPTTQPTSPVTSPKKTLPPVNAWGRGPAFNAASIVASASTQSTPGNSVPSEPASPATSSSPTWQTVTSGRTTSAMATTEASRGAPTGPTRGAPVWSSRGRGKGRGTY